MYKDLTLENNRTDTTDNSTDFEHTYTHTAPQASIAPSQIAALRLID